MNHRFLTIPSNSDIKRKNKKIPIFKIQNNNYLEQINKNNKFYKETISSINKKYSSRNNSPLTTKKKNRRRI